MLYVGVVGSFPTMKEANVVLLEVFGRSVGRAKRFLDAHPPKFKGEVLYKSVALVLPDGVRLRNDLIQQTIREYHCTWDTAKFHLYRHAANNIVGNKDDWKDLLKA